MSDKIKVNTAKAPAAIGPYSQAIQIGSMIFTSGQIPFTAEGKLVSEDVQEQARQSLENLKSILEESYSDSSSNAAKAVSGLNVEPGIYFP